MSLGLVGCVGMTKEKEGGVFVTTLYSCIVVSQITFGKENGYLGKVGVEDFC